MAAKVTVGDLIEMLKEYPEDMPVVVDSWLAYYDGSEGAIEYPMVKVVKIRDGIDGGPFMARPIPPKKKRGGEWSFDEDAVDALYIGDEKHRDIGRG